MICGESPEVGWERRRRKAIRPEQRLYDDHQKESYNEMRNA
jgi:hypothetical protein